MTRKALALFSLLAAPAFGWTAGAASTSWSGLLIPRGARPAALGGAYTALASGADSLSWNPAGMNQVRALQVSAGHLAWIDGVNDENLSLALPIYGMGAWGVGVHYLGADDQSYDVEGNPTHMYHADEVVAQLGLSLELPWDLHFGGAYKMLRQSYATQSSMGSAFDVGLQWRELFKRLDLGLVVQNAGTPVALGDNSFNLPVTGRFGAVLHLFPQWLLSADYERQFIDYFDKVRVGTELNKAVGPLLLSTRLGQAFGADQSQGDWAGFGAGLGLGMGPWQLDYAFNPQGDLGQSHRVSLTYSSWR